MATNSIIEQLIFIIEDHDIELNDCEETTVELARQEVKDAD